MQHLSKRLITFSILIISKKLNGSSNKIISLPFTQASRIAIFCFIPIEYFRALISNISFTPSILEYSIIDENSLQKYLIFSRPLILPISAGSSIRIPIFERGEAFSFMSIPFISTCPLYGKRFDTHLINVLFPLPFAPKIPTLIPFLICI